MNNIDYSNKEWEILLEPWLNLYLETNYFRWLLINELTKIHKNFNYLEIKVRKEFQHSILCNLMNLITMMMYLII